MVLEDILELEHPGLGRECSVLGFGVGRRSRRSSRYSPNYCKPGKWQTEQPTKKRTNAA